jgi:hypothetical protein
MEILIQSLTDVVAQTYHSGGHHRLLSSFSYVSVHHPSRHGVGGDVFGASSPSPSFLRSCQPKQATASV